MPKEVGFEQLALRLGEVFKPATPIDNEQLFRGRVAEIRSVADAINQTGQHVILYGERGVGKTSLAQILATKLDSTGSQAPILPLLVNCDSGDDYQSIWRKVFSEVRLVSEGDSMGFVPTPNRMEVPVLSTIPDAITPHEVRSILTGLGNATVVYSLLDEFDKVQNAPARNLIADTIKLLSDRSVRATIILVGVADDVSGLIDDHRSIERCLAQIHMPRMPRPELEQIVTGGLKAVGMSIEGDALDEICGLSKGLPHYTHLLSLHAGRQALDRQTRKISPDDVQQAIEVAISKAQESIRMDYDRATYSTKKNTLHVQVLLACAMAETDDFGRFQPAGICEPMQRITEREFTTDRFARHLHAFCEESRGPVLLKTGGEYRWKYRFANPLMQPFVLMKGLAEGMISKVDLRLDRDANGQRRMSFPRK